MLTNRADDVVEGDEFVTGSGFDRVQSVDSRLSVLWSPAPRRSRRSRRNTQSARRTLPPRRWKFLDAAIAATGNFAKT